MKIEKNTNELISNTSSGNTFAIKASSHAFLVLSNGLYSNKIRAIVRELSTNAIDSHTAANKDIPFEIKLPTALDSTFYVKDFGIGLSHDDIMGYTDSNGLYHSGIYNTYFSSTKQDSNEFIGALGLGSKTPFCYVSNFMVISTHNGVKSTYSCYLNEDHVPAVNVLSVIETDECNGLTVQFAVDQKDHRRFQSETESVIKYFNIQPIVNLDIDRSPIEYHFEKSNWKFIKNGNAKINIIQGGVCYPIDLQQLSGKFDSDILSCFHASSFDIFVDIGDVDVSASREHLSYTKKTVEFLVSQFNKIYWDIRSYIDEEFNKCDTLWSTIIQYRKLKSDRFHRFLLSYIVFKNLISKYNYPSEITPDRIKIEDIKSTKIINYYKSHGAFDKMVSVDTHVLMGDATIVIVDTNNYSKDQLKHLVTEHKQCNVVVLKQTSRLKDSDELDYLKKLLGDSYIETTKKSSRGSWASVKNELTTVYSISAATTGRYSNWNVSWDTEEIDLSIGGYYCPYNRGCAYYNGIKIGDIRDVISKANICGFVNINDKIYGMTPSNEKKLPDNWINIFDYVYSKVNHNVVDMNLVASELSNNYSGCKSALNTLYKDGDFLDPIFKEFIGDITECIKKTNNQSANEHALLRSMGVEKRQSAALRDYLQKYAIIFMRYPMLNLVRFDAIYGSDTVSKTYKHILNYVNFIYTTTGESK